MKKIFLLIFLISFCFSGYPAEREKITTTIFRTSQLVKRGETRVYYINFVATANGGNFMVLDALTDTTTDWGNTNADVKAEGSEATSANSQPQNFNDRPLELSTGLYLTITDGYVTLRYE